MTDNTKMREEFEKWNNGPDSLTFYSCWKAAWQAAQMECKHSDSEPTRLPTDAAFRWLADNAVEPEATVQKLGKRLAEMLDEHHFSEVEALLIRILHAHSITAQELERLRKDAERYRWMRDGNDTKKSAACHIAVNCYGIEWDAAIDAAIAGEKK